MMGTIQARKAPPFSRCDRSSPKTSSGCVRIPPLMPLSPSWRRDDVESGEAVHLAEAACRARCDADQVIARCDRFSATTRRRMCSCRRRRTFASVAARQTRSISTRCKATISRRSERVGATTDCPPAPRAGHRRRQQRSAEWRPRRRRRHRPGHGSPAGRQRNAIDQALYDAFGQRQVSTLYAGLNQYHVVMEVAPEYWQQPETLTRCTWPAATVSYSALGNRPIRSIQSPLGSTISRSFLRSPCRSILGREHRWAMRPSRQPAAQDIRMPVSCTDLFRERPACSNNRWPTSRG